VTLFVGQAGNLMRQRASQAAGFVAVIIGAAVLTGLPVGLPLLSSWGSGFPNMRPVGALGLAALGIALIHPGKDSRVAFAVGVAAAALAALSLGLALLSVELGIDRWLVPQAAVSGPTAFSFRMANAATLAFGLAGGSLALSRFERHRFAATMLGGIAGVIAVFALLGYLTGIDTLYGSASVSSPPLPTAVGLLCVAGGIIFRIGGMPALRRPRPLWHLLVMLGCAIIAPLLLFGAYAEVTIADARLDQVRKDLMHEARTLSADIDREIIGEIERLQALAASPSLRQGDFAEFQHQAEASLAMRQSGNIMLVDRSMQQLANTSGPFGTPSQNAAIPETAERALVTGKPQVIDLFIEPVTKQPMFGIIVPVQIENESRYALVRLPNQHALEGLVAPHELGWHAVVSDAAHHIVARSEQLDAFFGKELPEAQLYGAGPGGVFEFIDSEGQPSLEAYVPSELTGWETAVWEPKAVLEAPVKALWRTMGMMALLAFALVVALASWLGRIIARSVGHAARAAVALGEGGPLPPGETPVAEVNTLMAELRETAARRQAAGSSLRDSERQLRLVTDNAPVGIMHCDAELRYKFINRYHAERLMARLGLTPEQVIGKRVMEVLGDKLFAVIEPYVHECLAGQAVEFELEVPYQTGEPQFIHCRFEPEWRDGKVVGFVSAGTDVTGLKRAEQRLRASEITFRQLVENSPFGIYAVDADFRIVQVSAGAQKAFENVRPLIGRDLAEALRCMWPEPFASDAIGRFRRALDTGEPYHAPASVELRKDTDAVESYDWKIERVTMPDGRLGVVCHFYDLTERQKYEAALRESEETFRAMFDLSSVGKIEVEPETGRFLRANAAMCKFVGYSEAELLSRTVFDITHPDDRDPNDKMFRRLVAGESAVFDAEKRYVRKDGNVVWARATANLIRDGSGRPLRHTAVVQDLNARKQAEQALQASKDRLQLAMDAAQLGSWQYDPLRRVVSGDTCSQEIFDVTAGEMPFKEIMKRVHPDDAEKVWAALEATLNPVDPKRSATEFRLRRGDGEIRWVETLGLAYFEGTGRERRAVRIVGTVADITERKECEEKEHLLMREVNHRAKNMLSVVDAIAHQTATQNPEDFIERFSERIQALSANQDLLVRNEWKGVEIEDLVHAQLAHFAGLIGSRIVGHGPRLRVKAGSAQAIGLALHELATNAGKYGALSTDRGRVDICWRRDGDTFMMSWTERDGPPVSPPARRGFGTIVMEMMAERSLGGAVHLDYAPSGVTWRLTCPATNALEPSERQQISGEGKT
jgi:PAS domain S-box-containing protein